MIEFNDLSHWNTEQAFLDALSAPVIAMKCSEGKTFIDGAFFKRLEKIPADKIVIAYHFLRADNYAKALPDWLEMEHYLSVLRAAKRPLVMALDYESPFCTNNAGHFDYAYKCISYLLTKTGKAPYIYINESQLTSAKKQGYSFPWIWCAKWSKTPPVHECGIWQYTSRPIDFNYFMSDNLDLLRRHLVEVK